MSAYNCRAVLLLQKELGILKKLDLWGVQVDTMDDNIFTWKLTMSGLQGSTWEVRQDGAVCLDCLEEWNNHYSMSFVILSLQLMLSEPSLNYPVNTEAARLFSISPNHYKQLALDSVFASQRNKSAMSSLAYTNAVEPQNRITLPQSKDDGNIPKYTGRYQVSFENYLAEWKTLGTTHPGVENVNEAVHQIHVPSDGEGHDRVSGEAFKEKLVSHGPFGTVEMNKKQSKMDQLKATRMQLLKDIRSNKRGGLDMRMVLPESQDDDIDVDSTEVNSIVSWTENLPTD